MVNVIVDKSLFATGEGVPRWFAVRFEEITCVLGDIDSNAFRGASYRIGYGAGRSRQLSVRAGRLERIYLRLKWTKAVSDFNQARHRLR